MDEVQNKPNSSVVWVVLIWLSVGTSGRLLWSRFHKMLGNSSVFERLQASRGGLGSMELPSYMFMYVCMYVCMQLRI
jgi:hypothetical protein